MKQLEPNLLQRLVPVMAGNDAQRDDPEKVTLKPKPQEKERRPHVVTSRSGVTLAPLTHQGLPNRPSPDPQTSPPSFPSSAADDVNSGILHRITHSPLVSYWSLSMAPTTKG